MSKVPYCGIKKVPKGRRRGTSKECKESNQIRYYGLTNADVEMLFAPKQKKKLIKKSKPIKKDIQKPKIKPIKQIIPKNENIYEYNNIKFYIHPRYEDWASNENGDIIFIPQKKILKPKMTDTGMVINVASGYGYRFYNVDKFVYESIYDIEDAKGDIIHIDGDYSNNKIQNLAIINQTHRYPKFIKRL